MHCVNDYCEYNITVTDSLLLQMLMDVLTRTTGALGKYCKSRNTLNEVKSYVVSLVNRGPLSHLLEKPASKAADKRPPRGDRYKGRIA